MTKPAPTKKPEGPQECFDYLSEPDAYEGENQSDYDSRQNLYQKFLSDCEVVGLTPAEAIKMSQSRIIVPPQRKIKMGQR